VGRRQTSSRVLVALTLVLVLLSACGGGSGPGPGSGGGGGSPGVTLDPANAAVDNAAKALLSRGLRAGNTYHTQAGDTYEGFDAAAAAEIDAEIEWVDGTDPEVGQLSITEVSDINLHLVTRSESGLYFCLRNLRQFGRGEYVTEAGAAFEDVETECRR
jgi:hypothetical protein